MSNQFYTYKFSPNGFENNSNEYDRALILLFDTNSVDAERLLKSELTKEYVKHCSLLILQGEKPRDFEDLADDYLLDLDEVFVPTATSTDIEETADLIFGWEVKKKKSIKIVSDKNNLASGLETRLS